MTKSKRILKQVNFTERLIIQNLLESGLSQRQISIDSGVSRTSIHRELKRCSGSYNAEEAQLHCDDIKLRKSNHLSTFKKDIKSRLQYLEDRVRDLENLLKK